MGSSRAMRTATFPWSCPLRVVSPSPAKVLLEANSTSFDVSIDGYAFFSAGMMPSIAVTPLLPSPSRFRLVLAPPDALALSSMRMTTRSPTRTARVSSR